MKQNIRNLHQGNFFYLAALVLFNSLLFSSCTTQQSSQQSTQKTTATDFKTPFEKNTNYTSTHDEVIAYYQLLAKAFPKKLQFEKSGMTDSGRPLHTGILSLDGDFDPNSNRAKKKCILFINNAIHPGEPTGVDATMMLVRDILTKKVEETSLKNAVIVFIPMYNIGGALNRGGFSRANQVGPEAHGFRGNSRNFDLNRDFIKCDTRNAQSFNQIFTQWKPHIFVDNHTSNGADYQYVMTLIPTQHNKLNPILSDYLTQKMLPQLYKGMETANFEMTPYVYVRNTPDDGIAGFLDLPRYSSGYAALFNCLSFMPEAHMLKTYEQRVRGTYAFMETMLDLIEKDYVTIIENRIKADEKTINQKEFAVNWTMNRDKKDEVVFKGYAAKYKKSEVSGQDRLYYDKNEPYTKKIPFFNTYEAIEKVSKPWAYVIPKGYSAVVDRLKWNGIEVETLQADKKLKVEMYYIKDYKTVEKPYEGHYLHSKIEVEGKEQTVQFYKGDYIIKTNQAENQYLIHALEPTSADSYFAWNFFDAILQQKEYFSPYVFEDVAAELLKTNPDLRKRFDAKKAADEKFANNAYAQLLFIYQNSPHYEKTHNRYPIGRAIEAF